jgi:hypothetical protein
LEFGQRGENERPAKTKDMRSILGIRHFFDHEGSGLHRVHASICDLGEASVRSLPGFLPVRAF